jgi:hypothetical protein
LASRLAKSETISVPTHDEAAWKITISPAIERAHAAPMAIVLADATTLVAQQDDAAQPPTETPASPEPAAPVPTAPSDASDDAPAGDIAIEPMSGADTKAGDYQRVYASVPFSRAEYLANPSYRHDTAMELLTGNQRQVVIHRNYTPRLHEPRDVQPIFLYNRYGGGVGFGGPYGGGGYGFGLGWRYIPQYAPAFRYFLPIEYGY